jgi:hypothetical protein
MKQDLFTNENMQSSMLDPIFDIFHSRGQKQSEGIQKELKTDFLTIEIKEAILSQKRIMHYSPQRKWKC